MRTTLTHDNDMADRTRTMAQKVRKPFKAVVNQALRLGKEWLALQDYIKRFGVAWNPKLN